MLNLPTLLTITVKIWTPTLPVNTDREAVDVGATAMQRLHLSGCYRWNKTVFQKKWSLQGHMFAHSDRQMSVCVCVCVI